MRICAKCGIEKPLSEYTFEKNRNQYRAQCKDCRNGYRRKRYLKNKQYYALKSKQWRENNSEYYKEYNKKYHAENRERLLEKGRKYHAENRERISIRRKNKYANDFEYREEIKKKTKEYGKKRETKDRLNEQHRVRRRTDTQWKLTQVLRVRLNKAIHNNQKVGSAVVDLGCTIEELKTHLENQFQEGMTWENWKHDGWHIDHIKPLNSFDLTDREQFLEACHYKNLQPLWGYDNMSKGNKIDWECEFK